MPATFDDLIRDPAAKKVFFLEAKYFDLTTHSSDFLYVGTEQHITGLDEDPPHTCYREGLDISSWVERSLVGSGGRLGGIADIGAGETVLHNLDGHFDYLWHYAFDGLPFTIYVAGEDSPGRLWERSRWVPVLVGQHASHVVGMERVTLQARDPRVALDVPLSTDFYKGFGTCLFYDGVNDKAVSASTFSPQASPTVEFRLRVLNANTAGTAQVVMYHASAWTSAGREWYFEISTAGVLSCVIERRSGGAALTLTNGSVDVRDSAWRHVALVIDSGTSVAALYVDGVAVASGIAPTLSAAVCELGIGANYGATGNWSNVEVDEVRYWSAVRAASDLVDNRNKTVDPTTATLLHYWRMDEATGGTAFDQVTSGAINLTITGATWVSTYEGREDLVGRVKPRTVGSGASGNNVEGVLVDPQLGIRQFNNGRIRKFRTVYWDGVAKTEGADYTADLARGCVTPLVAVDGVVTADIDGEADGGYLENPVDILRRLFTGYSPLTGDALALNGTTGYVDGTNASNCNFTSGDFTLEIMVRPTSFAGVPMLISRGVFNTDGYYLALLTTGAVHFATNQSGASQATETAAGAAALNKWQRISLTRSGATCKIYIDGIDRTSVSGVHVNPTTSTRKLYIGTLNGATQFLSGRVDDVRLWNVARSPADVKDYAWQELAGNETGLVQYWKLNDRTGTSATSSVAGGATGALNGGTTWMSSEDGSVTIAAAPFDWTTTRALSTAAITHHWSEPTTKLEAISEVADGPGLFASYESTGALRIGRVDLPLASRLGASAVYLDGAWNGSVYTSLKASVTAALDDTDCALAFEAWIYPYETDGTRTVAAKNALLNFAGGLVGFVDGWRLYLDEGVPTLQAINSGGAAVAQASTAIPVRAWTHLAACAQPGTAGKLRLLVNGVEAATDTLPAGTFSTNGALWVGSLEGIAHPFVGVVDEARLWNNPRTAANVARDLLQEIASTTYQELGDNGAVATMHGYWSMNDGSGNTASDSIGSADFDFQGSPRWCRAVAATIRAEDLLAMPEALSADLPHALVRVGWGPCFRLLTDAELASSVSAARRAFVKEAFRWATHESAATRTAHLLTRDLDAVQAHFSTEAAGKAEAVRLSAIYGRDRRMFRVRAARQFGRLEPGDLVRLVYNRQGMGNGSDFLALSARELPSTSEVLSTSATLWG